MKFGVTFSGLASRIAAARVERLRAEVVRASLAELAWRVSGSRPVDGKPPPDASLAEVSQSDASNAPGTTQQQRS